MEDDPVDLLMTGRSEQALKSYLEVYAAALASGDESISADLCAQMLYCVALSSDGHGAETRGSELLDIVQRELDIGDRERLGRVKMHIERAVDSLREMRQLSEKSFEPVERGRQQHGDLGEYGQTYQDVGFLPPRIAKPPVQRQLGPGET